MANPKSKERAAGSANTVVSDNKRKPPKSAWKPGQSGNPKGAPKRGESWAEVIKRISELTPSEAAQMSLELSKKLLSIGDGVTLKQAVVLRVYSALLFEPDARLFNSIMDRAEGKVTQAITVEDVTGKPDSELVDELFAIANAARARAGADVSGGADAPGADASQPAD